MDTHVIIHLASLSVMCGLYIYATNLAFWWNEFPLLKSNARWKECVCRSLGFAVLGLLPLYGIGMAIVMWFLTEGARHGYLLSFKQPVGDDPSDGQ